TECLLGPCVDEQIERGDDLGEVLTRPRAQEHGTGQERPEPGLARPLTGENQPDPGQILKTSQTFERFLGREPADVTDNDLSPGSNFAPTSLRPLLGREQLEVDAARPVVDAGHAQSLQLPAADVRGRQCAVGQAVDASEAALEDRSPAGHAVSVGETSDI